jgi:diguanylate cyclase (GGDEF)-like protein
VVVASFGEELRRRVGSRVRSDRGIAGFVYRTGQAHSGPTSPSEGGWGELGMGTRLERRAVLCVPIALEGDVIGVLELVNRHDGESYTQRQLELLEIFAQTISASIANAVEAQRSKEMAQRDELTGLFNDRHMHYVLSDLVAEALKEGRECGLLFIDLDAFKGVNDAFGHLAGSRVLREMGQILRQVLPGPAVPTRYGGDEFVIILPGGSKQELFWVAETIRQNIESHVFLAKPDPGDPVHYPALEVVITCSIGLASLSGDVMPLFCSRVPDALEAKNELIRVADARMYRAKDQGKNRTVVSDDASADEEREDPVQRGR